MRRSAYLLYFVPVFLISSCISLSDKKIDIQGHRGARGYLPENSIPAFILALESGVTTLELDVVVSADKKLVVSHDPWMSAEICSYPDGRAVADSEQTSLNLYKMTYDEIAKFDCGKRGNARFPLQKAMPATKPLLSSVVASVEAFIEGNKLDSVGYNIETKSEPQGDGIYHPLPAEFAKLLYDELNKSGIAKRTTVQSFDVRTLQEMRALDSAITLALLVEEGDFNEHLAALGFTPEIYSPNYTLVTQELMRNAHEKKVRVIPWTVNDSTEMKKLIKLGVDGIITDYPDVGVKIAQSYEGKR